MQHIPKAVTLAQDEQDHWQIVIANNLTGEIVKHAGRLDYRWYHAANLGPAHRAIVEAAQRYALHYALPINWGWLKPSAPPPTPYAPPPGYEYFVRLFDNIAYQMDQEYFEDGYSCFVLMLPTTHFWHPQHSAGYAAAKQDHLDARALHQEGIHRWPSI
jgi:hypothetical protein